MSLPSPFFRLVLGLTLLGLGGCNATPFGPAGSSLPSVTQPGTFDRIARGMSADEVRTLVGRPHGLSPTRYGGVDAETWHYLHKVDETVRQMPIATKDVPAVNPITGQSIIIQEPVMADVFTTLYEDVELVMADGRVVEISRRRRVEQKVH